MRALVAAMVLAGCSSAVGGASVTLLTAPSAGPGCYTNSAEGQLVVDPTYGTAIIDNDLHATVPVPVMWRPGYTARRVNDQVVVSNPTGHVIATTGRAYRIAGGYVGDSPRVFFACDFVTPE